MRREKLVTCCGMYCGTCARWTEHPAVRTCAAALAEVMDGHGFQHWMPEAVKEFDYAEFRKGLEFFQDSDTWLVCRVPCRDNPQMARCRIRQCCERREITLCFDCTDFPCQDVEWPQFMLASAEEYGKLGRQEWLRSMVERAKRGYEHHTGKCYCLSTT